MKSEIVFFVIYVTNIINNNAYCWLEKSFVCKHK